MPEVTSYTAGAPAWVDLVSSDPEGARAFYGSLFGWDFDIGPAETGYYTMCRLGGRNAAGMNGSPGPEGMPTMWTTYLASDDADQAAQRITDAGGTLMMGPMDVLTHGRLVVATDPTGALFGVWQGRDHIGAGVANEPGAIVWNEIATRDLAAAQEFYTKVFGYRWEVEDTGPEGPPYQTFWVDDRLVGGAMQMTAQWPDDIPPHWMPYFAVDETDAAVATVERLGGAVQVPPTDSPYGRFAVVRDPQGGVFTVMGITEGG